MFLLDTDVVGHFRKKSQNRHAIAWLQSVARDTIHMASPTVVEIQCGIGLIPDRQHADQVQLWLDEMIRNGRPRVVDFDSRAAVLLGQMWSCRPLNNFIVNDPRSKKAKSGADLAIAAVAISHAMTVVTGNVDDFLEIGAVFPLPGLLNPFIPAAS